MRYIFLLLISVSNLNCKQYKKEHIDLKKECIAAILKKDDSLGVIRNHECENISLSETIRNYTKSLKQIDFSNCPIKFHTAFKTHIEAWNSMTLITDNHKELRGEMHELFNIIEKSKDSITFKNHLKTIWDTWKVIEESQHN